jgi:hypothetical protein
MYKCLCSLSLGGSITAATVEVNALGGGQQQQQQQQHVRITRQAYKGAFGSVGTQQWLMFETAAATYTWHSR